MPPDFPEELYNTHLAQLASVQPQFPIEYRHHAGAWSAVAYRFRAAAEADYVYQETFAEASDAEERFRHEVALFGFFTNSVAVFDSCAYALYAMASIFEAAKFPMTPDRLRKVDFRSVATDFATHFPTEELTKKLSSIQGDLRQAEIRDIRNLLAHRVASTRSYTLSTGSGPNPAPVWYIDLYSPASGMTSFDIDGELTNRYRSFLAKSLEELLLSMATFVKSRL